MYMYGITVTRYVWPYTLPPIPRPLELSEYVLIDKKSALGILGSTVYIPSHNDIYINVPNVTMAIPK